MAAPAATGRRLRAATRGSALALRQTELVAALLGGAVEAVVVETVGDRRTDVPIASMGGQGVFVKEVQAAVLDGRCDLAVHSAKDLPSVTPDGLVIAAVPEREDARDVLVGAALEDLPVGGCVGTGSVRRRAQLACLRPDLTFGDLRGNIGTRLDKAVGFDAIVVAAAALHRLGRAGVAAEYLDPRVVVPQVAQGALAVECRADDEATRAALAAIEHRPSRLAVDAERAYLREIGGGCDLPVGAHAVVDGDDLRMIVVLSSGDGRVMLRVEGAGRDPDELGRRLAAQVLEAGAELLEGLPPDDRLAPAP